MRVKPQKQNCQENIQAIALNPDKTGMAVLFASVQKFVLSKNTDCYQ